MADRAPDVIIVGAGIVGLAHALAATRRGKRVMVFDRDAQANGASIRNFGFATVSGQERGQVWVHARRSAELWREVAPQAGIPIEHEGMLLVARRREAADVIDAFMATEMGDGCTRLSAQEVAARFPMVQQPVSGAMVSSADARVESRDAIPRLTAWLAAAHGVDFRFRTAVQRVESGRVVTSDGVYGAETIIVCPGDDGTTLFCDLLAAEALTKSKLQMLRLAPPGWRLPHSILSDLSMVRYLGWSDLPEAAPLRARIDAEECEALGYGIHLIVVQSADGSLVVGDSHVYAPTPDPFASTEIDKAILHSYADVLGAPPPVIERWTGTYASGRGHSIVRTPADGVRLVVVTSGTGASTAFSLAETVIADLFGPAGAHL